MTTKSSGSDLTYIERTIILALLAVLDAFLIMLAVPALGGTVHFGYLDYLAGVAGLIGFIHALRIGAKI